MSLSPTLKAKVRANLRATALAGIANEPRIHYDQARRFYYDDQVGVGNSTFDCSGWVGNAFWNAMHDLGVYIHDPLDCKYTGIGNTSTLEAYLRAHGKKVTTQGFLIGDIARVGVGLHSHVIYCYKAGTAKTALWVSHGWEGGPLSVKWAEYRVDEHVGVWRHPALV